MSKDKCFHCGDDCSTKVYHDDKVFCCNGCKTVFEIFSENDLTCYYDLEQNPGATPNEINGKFDYLEKEDIVNKLIDFQEDSTEIVTLYIPHIHCSSCIWVLENLHKLNKHVVSSQVDFPKKKVTITYNTEEFSLKSLVELMSRIGYEPYISLENYGQAKQNLDRSLVYKIGVAGFAFGNVMFLSFPEYFEVSEYWLEQYKPVFRWLMFFFSLPVVIYAGQDYFKSAIKGLRSKILNIDIPIALGITVLFLRSTVDILFNLGSGFFDSLTGLVFFLLLGKIVQQKTYKFMSFERDYKSYFPIAVTKINSEGKEENTQVYEIERGDRLLIRNQELLPVDGVLMSATAEIDYSFVTGEAKLVKKVSGDKVYAGGKQSGSAVEIVAEKSVEQSYLTQLWSNDVFQKDYNPKFQSLIDKISKKFTVAVLSIAFSGLLFWLFYDASLALNVFTAVLIIACPCAIALATPFAMGNLLRIFGKNGFYLKNTNVLEQMAGLDVFVFDKTGTLTTNKKSDISYSGLTLSEDDKMVLKNSFRNSNHPLSRELYSFLSSQNIQDSESFEEHLGEGIISSYNDHTYKLGSAKFVSDHVEDPSLSTAVHISKDETYLGKFEFDTIYRKGVEPLFRSLDSHYKLIILSGDNEGEKPVLTKMLPKTTQMFFNQKPDSKMRLIEKIQSENKNVAMVGDGLNDAGALKQADIGIAISEDVNVFSPACDAIMDASEFYKLDKYVGITKKGIKIIKLSFAFSFLYNVIGLYFALTGQLQPVIAAILMPLSSISIVIFTTLATQYISKPILNEKPSKHD
ncbi:heavy metal translocating P-type ATPase metal-binding domain-containing protein [Psychroflexus sp. CAK8W]|uniref:Heavy metal translocating P-type ATPase metal-binding domain-containing protein n=1 Tax=Psychroflexus longus TaxID=2873596 RepID=A0ABS7XJS2_9FLAO|nr:heavy metal translocating P-type ATPase metal-binding domain-containing protein [Psychroflexus longus]MBZ9779218.1 heavy metal translocating P-type ATPase metal-binding domain-containing protein [Psychroflexus longus]